MTRRHAMPPTESTVPMGEPMSEPREVLRQRLLLQALWQRGRGDALAAWLRDDPERARSALSAYRGNGRALAERALAAAFPTVAELIGSEAFAGLARAFWQGHLPADGDIARHGETLPDYIAGDPQLAGEPYLADVARLDWAVHRAEPAADGPSQPVGLEHLAGEAAADCRLRLQPGSCLLHSRWPVAAIWSAHRGTAPDRFVPMREAMARSEAQSMLVRRDGWRVAVERIDDRATFDFLEAVLGGRSLGEALDRAGSGFDFPSWLVQAVQGGWLAAVDPGDAGPDDLSA